MQSCVVDPRICWAVVTGGSSGIGLEFSRQLAAMGYNLILVSNQQEQLIEAANSIKADFAVECEPLFQDLSETDSAQNVFNYCSTKNVKILINNAGLFSLQQFTDHSLKTVELYLGVHLTTFTRLCYLFSSYFANNGGGYILNMSSLAAYFNIPGIALYQATKSYVWSLSKSLWYEFYNSNVSITALAPGGVNTSLYRLKPSLLKLGVNLGILTPTNKLVRKGLRAMFRRRRGVIVGFLNILFIPIIKCLPTCVILQIKKYLKQYEWK